MQSWSNHIERVCCGCSNNICVDVCKLGQPREDSPNLFQLSTLLLLKSPEGLIGLSGLPPVELIRMYHVMMT